MVNDDVELLTCCRLGLITEIKRVKHPVSIRIFTMGKVKRNVKRGWATDYRCTQDGNRRSIQ